MGSIWILFGLGQLSRTASSKVSTRAYGDECLNVEVFFTAEDVREKLTRWPQDYHLARPHSALQDQAPASFAADWCAATRIIQESHEQLEPLT